MKKNDVVFCSLCGKKHSFSSTCCERPTLASFTNSDSKKINEIEEINYIKKLVKYCVWCGALVKWKRGNFTKKCETCSKNVRGGKFFRLDETLSFCENCGMKV